VVNPASFKPQLDLRKLNFKIMTLKNVKVENTVNAEVKQILR